MKTRPIATANLGFPRIGLHRELKFALERFWAGEWTHAQLHEAARDVRRARWQMQADAGLVRMPSNDFSLYDHVLDTAVLTGATPARFRDAISADPLTGYFAMARGSKAAPAMEMTKWFDTNYHYIVPEFEPGMEFRVASRKPVEEFLEAKALGFDTRPVLLGPVSFTLLGKVHGTRTRFEIAEALAEVCRDVLNELGGAGAAWVQIDEPCLSLDLPDEHQELFRSTYGRLASSLRGVKVLIATYFSDLRETLDLALDLPVSGLHLDLVRGPEQLASVLEKAPPGMLLSLGVINGRNVWRADLDIALDQIRRAVDRLGPERIEIAPSCSLMHIPIDLGEESQLDPELKNWLAFARQKLEELNFLSRAAVENSPEVADRLAENRRILAARRGDPRIRDPRVRDRVAAITPEMLQRASEFPARRRKQALRTPLPLLPTTTIGSFPQTAEIRRARAAHRSGKLPGPEYDALLRTEIERAVRFQEEAGLDVLVHGEFERNDMVEYFAGQLAGFAFTANGWVQSYGSRCVKPPVLFGDVFRPSQMTVEWARYAQSLTSRPVKGMLTGPVTMLQWSFVRDDLPRDEVCFQIALAVRDEVKDLESAGIRVIQIDEPALREGLPLRQADRAAYLAWSVDAFRLAASIATDETQIHTHMCYSEFTEILDAVARMDADVISMEAARSRMELIDAFMGREYLNDIGPGVYDIHSPRVPAIDEIEDLIRKALKVFGAGKLWVNPDCGLKTRRWEEVRPALENMVAAARNLRADWGSHAGTRAAG